MRNVPFAMVVVHLATFGAACAVPVSSADETAEPKSLCDEGACDGFEPEGTVIEDTGPVVRFVYMVPSDRTVSSDSDRGITRAAYHVQRFFYEQLDGVTFRLQDSDFVAEIVFTDHPASYYATNPVSDPWNLWWQRNTTRDGFALTGARFDDPDNIWIFYNDSEPACGQMAGAGTNGVAAMPANDLLGLARRTGAPVCLTDSAVTYDAPPCRWVGGLAHELGHALGLHHPPDCPADDPGCNSFPLMGLGYVEYPAAYFRAEDLATLAASPFLRPRAASEPFDCQAL